MTLFRPTSVPRFTNSNILCARSSVSGIVIAMALLAAGCASAPIPQLAPTPTPRFEAVATENDSGDSTCPSWQYPEVTSQVNTWVNLGCTACGELPQSPISVNTTSATSGGPVSVHVPKILGEVKEAPLDVAHHTYTFPILDNPAITVGTFPYTLTDFHLHSPAEHVTSQGVPVDLEMHVKGFNQTGGKTVLAVFAVAFSDGLSTDSCTYTGSEKPSSSPYFEGPPLVGLAKRVSGMESEGFGFDVTRALGFFSSQPFFNYTGSLTTPPCGAANVQWYVLPFPLAIKPSVACTIKTALQAKAGGPNAREMKLYSSQQFLQIFNAPTLTMQTPVVSGDPMLFYFSGGAIKNPTDWIGIYPGYGSTDGPPANWAFISGSQAESSSCPACPEGSCQQCTGLTLSQATKGGAWPLSPGPYTAYYFIGKSHSSIAYVSFKILPP